MKHKTTFKLYEYWDSLRGTRTAPQRSEVEPAAIRDILSQTFILNAERGDEYTYRLAGSRVCSHYCRELKGRNFLSFWGGEDLSALQTLLLAIKENGAAAVLGWQGHTMRRQTLAFETVLLPLETRPGSFNRVLGSTSAMDNPYWVGIHPILEQEIVSLRMIWPNESPMFAAPAAEEQEASPPAIAVDPDTGAIARRFGHLLVYDGGKKSDSNEIGV